MNKKDKHLVISCQAVNFHLWATGTESKVIVCAALTLLPVNTGVWAPVVISTEFILYIVHLINYQNITNKYFVGCSNILPCGYIMLHHGRTLTWRNLLLTNWSSGYMLPPPGNIVGKWFSFGSHCKIFNSLSIIRLSIWISLLLTSCCQVYWVCFLMSGSRRLISFSQPFYMQNITISVVKKTCM